MAAISRSRGLLLIRGWGRPAYPPLLSAPRSAGTHRTSSTPRAGEGGGEAYAPASLVRDLPSSTRGVPAEAARPGQALSPSRPLPPWTALLRATTTTAGAGMGAGAAVRVPSTLSPSSSATRSSSMGWGGRRSPASGGRPSRPIRSARPGTTLRGLATRAASVASHSSKSGRGTSVHSLGSGSQPHSALPSRPASRAASARAGRSEWPRGPLGASFPCHAAR